MECLPTEYLPDERWQCLVLSQGEASVLTQAEEAPKRLQCAGREPWLSTCGIVGCIADLLRPCATCCLCVVVYLPGVGRAGVRMGEAPWFPVAAFNLQS